MRTRSTSGWGTSTPRAATRRCCVDERVRFWRRWDETEARLTRPVSERMLDLAGIRAGMRVLDVASGRGEPAIPAAHRVGKSGVVLGIDNADGILEIARERARREGLTN